jgi:hypothetical protein
MKFCPVVPEICHGQVLVPKKERRIKRKKEENNNNKNGAKTMSPCLGDLIRNGAKTISLQTLFGRLNN